MAFRVEPVSFRIPPVDSVDRLFAAIIVSFLLHVIICAVLYIASIMLTPSPVTPPKPESYVVHLVEPGPKAGPVRTTSRMKHVGRTVKYHSPAKTIIKPKKIVPITKEKPAPAMSLGKAAPVKKVPVKEKVKVKRTPEIVQQKEAGGKIDIKKFPYEWYLRILEHRINGNWDTLSVNFYSDHPLKTVVYFQIDRKGGLKGLKLSKPSFNDAVDKSALEAVRLSAPFPPLPPGYREDYLEVYFGFVLESR